MTNLQARKWAIPVIAASIILVFLALLPRWDLAVVSRLRYARCTALLHGTAGEALNYAHGWRAAHPLSPIAEHCEALALFGTRHYAEAAAEFSTLAAQVSPTDTTLAADLFTQSAEAYGMAGQKEQAKQAAASALLLEPGNVKIKALLDGFSAQTLKIPSKK